jgi:glutamate dehydrogenase
MLSAAQGDSHMMPGESPPRSARLEEVMTILRRESPAEDRDLLLEFAPLVFADMPLRIALELPPAAVAARLMSHFRYVAREIPPPHQLYRGLPGIHVSVWNPDDETARSLGGGTGLPVETTIVQTHTADRPFIFDSLLNYFQRSGLRVYSAIHPMFTVRRQWERIVSFGDVREEGGRESYCFFQIEPLDSKERVRRVEHEVFSLLKAVFLSVDDFDDMRRACRDLVKRLRSPRGDESQLRSSREFVEWLLQDNYIFMGTVSYEVEPDGRLTRADETAGGAFVDPTLLPIVFPGVAEHLEGHLHLRPDDTRIIDLDFCTSATAIYHLEPIEDMSLREWDESGRLRRLTFLLGRFARGAFTQRADQIPILREKQRWLLRRSGAAPHSYIWRRIRATFNLLPKSELLYADVEDLKRIIDRIVHVASDDEVIVQGRQGPGYEVLYVAFSRLRYSYRTERELGRALGKAFGPVAFSTSVGAGAVSVLIFYFDAERLDRDVNIDEARQLAVSLVTTWEDRVSAALEAAFGEREGRYLFRRYVTRETRSGIYREATAPEEVPADLERLENLESRLDVRVDPRTAEQAVVILYTVRTLDLTDILKTLQNLGLTVVEELRIPLTLPEGRRCYIYRFQVEAPSERIRALLEGEQRVVEALRALDEERATDDSLNGLILSAGLGWRDVEVLRTLRNHLLQIRPHWATETVSGVLVRNAAVAGALYRSFAARFDPRLEGDRQAAMEGADAELMGALEGVARLVEDEVLNAFGDLIAAAVRTNAYQRPERPVFSIKVNSSRPQSMPSPRPMFEIYVHSRRLEGIHLRGGRIARGGIRWSDRYDDFRTEVLGLMKTQMVKNSVIVPVGSKGGFVLKGHLPRRPALDDYLADRYREYVSGLLDVTDNRENGRILHPPEVVRHDDDDAYLVVAADKGTAHLSDTANEVSSQYGFWLNDAFASGGSVGYDHKKMGITARGAWECVHHHFRNLDLDIQKDPFTVVGIGDMGGDVFGNGMLLSRAIRLVAAFNHLHIFLDPDPDPERSFAERQRLFALARSSWRDYDPSLISPGGGVFDRSAKAIPLSREARALLGTNARSASGEEVIRKILTARVDLLYNGGIGTYVKSSKEDHADVGDRGNDRVRVNGNEVRARVVGEGGNLGFTQLARLEYWAGGGLINTDAIDNCGGVSASDHEVNIKVLLDMLCKKGVIQGRDERDRIFLEMTDDVADLVLAANAEQALALSLDGLRSIRDYESFVHLIDDMAGAGLLSRSDEFVPRRRELLASRQRGRGLPRPLLGVLLGYAKISGQQLLLETDLPDRPAARPFLEGYFPRLLREHFSQHFEDHVLKRELVATAAVNYVVNRGGVTLLSRLTRGAEVSIGDAVAAWVDVDRASEAGVLREALRAARRPAAEEQEALLEVEDALAAAARDRLDGGAGDGGAATVRAVRDRLAL